MGISPVRTMKILFTRFPLESRYGGAEVQTLSLMQGLLKRRHAVAFLGSCPTLLHICWDNGIPAAELFIGAPPVSKYHALSFVWRKKKMQQKLETALDELHDIDAIVMLSLSEKILLTPLALKRGIRVIWLEHDGIGRWLTKNPWLPQLKEMAKSVTTVVVSDLSRDLYIDLGWPADRVESIPNGIDLERLQESLPTDEVHDLTERSGDTLHVGCIARLTKDKGIDLLIEAVIDLPQVTLTVVGSGREENFLRKLVEGNGLTDRVRIIPSVSSIGPFYRSLDAFILPSRTHDPFGLAAAEAMTLGIPTIMTDICGIARFLEAGKDAIVVRPDSSGALHEALRALLQRDKRAAIAHSGKCTAREKFSLEKMVDAYEEILVKN
ncbi:MAG: glycosyltransferase family 4 protein [Candidatus Peribacteraceae bacterium]|nr:glycosyltransferase family 4 protein [Candidatus Peribacteraceae bacterium]